MQNKKNPIIIANWKSNIDDYKKAGVIASGIAPNKTKNAIIGICPSYTHLISVGDSIDKRKILLGAQDVSMFPLGNHTGEIAAEVLAKLGVKLVILGHSERRAMGESDEDINKKIKICLKHKLIPLVCVGEIDPKEKAKVLRKQVLAAVDGLTGSDVSMLMFAYEPVSFIGKGSASSELNIFRSTLFIRSVISKEFNKKIAFSFPILYGGSVNMNNAKDIFENTEINGLLIGGASLKTSSFNSIIKSLC